MNFRRLLSTIQVSKKFMDFKLREFSLSTVQLRKEDPFNRNPRDPVSWASTKSIPLPHGQTLVDTSDVRPGTEKWHEPVSQPYSQAEKFKWPTYNDRIHSPDGTFRPAYVCHMRTKIKYSPDKMWYIGMIQYYDIILYYIYSPVFKKKIIISNSISISLFYSCFY